MRRAILVGIDEYAHTMPLVGCINDVKDMAAYLVGIGVETIHSLRGPAATRTAILKLLSEAIKALALGDELIVHYSGHGAALPGGGNVHAALCAFDFQPGGGGAIYDTEVADMLRTRAGSRKRRARRARSRPRAVPLRVRCSARSVRRPAPAL
jgi:uncharacterized caspase-like protein